MLHEFDIACETWDTGLILLYLQRLTQPCGITRARVGGLVEGADVHWGGIVGGLMVIWGSLHLVQVLVLHGRKSTATPA